jgi:hypothetical protein
MWQLNFSHKRKKESKLQRCGNHHLDNQDLQKNSITLTVKMTTKISSPHFNDQDFFFQI